MPVNPPYACQGRTDHPAALFRVALGGIATRPSAVGFTVPNGGVNPYFGNRLAVAGLASMNVSVDTGLAYVQNSTAWNGEYACYNTASVNVGIAASSSTQWRRDYIVAQVTDPGDNTAAWALAAVTGTFSSSAPGALPTIPSNAIPLAIINVVPNMTVTNGVGTVNDARQWMPLQGVWPTTSSAQPSTSSPEGTTWVESDTHQLGVILNGAVNYVVTTAGAAGGWTAMTLVNSWNNQAGQVAAQYKKVQTLNAVWLVGSVNPNGASSTTLFILPAGFRPSSQQAFAVTVNNTSQPANLFIQISTGGVVTMQNVVFNNTVIDFSCFVSLDA